MAALALALSVAVSGDARFGHSMPALQRREAAAAHLADDSCASAAGATPSPTKDVERDELEEYLSEPLVDDAEINLLEWWKHREARWPKLAKMAKQYLAAPASTAGVERVFSAAGKMHSDLRKSMQDSTLEHSLFAAFNSP